MLRIIGDLMWLHVGMYSADGVYLEGVCQYSLMSAQSSMAISAVLRPAFGTELPSLAALSVKLNAMLRWHLSSMTTSGRMVAMGDSHACSGHSMAVALEATLAGHLDDSAPAAEAVTGCQLREYASAGYFFNTLEKFTSF